MKKTNVILVLILGFALGLYVWSFNFFPVGAYRDDAQYVVLARALAQGSNPGAAGAAAFEFQHSAGWPLLLAPLYALSNGDLQVLKLLSLLFTLANIILLAWGWRRLGLPGPQYGLAVAALYALSPRVVRHASMVMSEPAFLFFVLVILILTVDDRRSRRYQLASAVALGAAWLFAVDVRATGLAVVLPSLSWLLVRRRFTKLAVAVACAGAILVVIVVMTGTAWRDFAGISEYLHQLANPGLWQSPEIARQGLIPRASQAAVEYGKIHLRTVLLGLANDSSLLDMLSQAHLAFMPSLISIILLGLVVAGCLSAIMRRILLPATAFAALYMMVILIWPARGDRFLYPIVPFLYVYLLLGSIAVLSVLMRLIRVIRIGPQAAQTAGAVCLALLLCAQVVAGLRLENWPDHMLDLRSGTVWIKDNSAPDALVLAEEQQVASIYAQRATLGLAEVAHIKTGSGRPPVFVLITPQLVWGPSPRQLTYSEGTRWMLGQLQSGGLAGQLVFEDRGNMVQVYRLDE